MFRVEPVSALSIEFPDAERDWDRVAGPHLRRLRTFAPSPVRSGIALTSRFQSAGIRQGKSAATRGCSVRISART